MLIYGPGVCFGLLGNTICTGLLSGLTIQWGLMDIVELLLQLAMAAQLALNNQAHTVRQNSVMTGTMILCKTIFFDTNKNCLKVLHLWYRVDYFELHHQHRMPGLWSSSSRGSVPPSQIPYIWCYSTLHCSGRAQSGIWCL